MSQGVKFSESQSESNKKCTQDSYVHSPYGSSSFFVNQEDPVVDTPRPERQYNISLWHCQPPPVPRGVVHKECFIRGLSYYPRDVILELARGMQPIDFRTMLGPDGVELFLGHLSFTMLGSQFPKTFDGKLMNALTLVLTGIQMQHVQPHWATGSGLFKGTLWGHCWPDEADDLLALHKRVICDEDGFLVANTFDQIQFLKEYSEALKDGSVKPQGPRVPRGAMTVEYARARRQDGDRPTATPSEWYTCGVCGYLQRRGDQFCVGCAHAALHCMCGCPSSSAYTPCPWCGGYCYCS